MIDITAKRMQVAGRLREIRYAMTANKSAFSRTLEMSRPHLDHLLNGSAGLADVYLHRLIEIGIDPTWLLTGQGKMFLPWREEQRIIEARNEGR